MQRMNLEATSRRNTLFLGCVLKHNTTVRHRFSTEEDKL